MLPVSRTVGQKLSVSNPATSATQGENRRPLWGTLEEIKEDIERYADAGLTELFLEANFDPNVSFEQTLEVMAALAPGNLEPR